MKPEPGPTYLLTIRAPPGKVPEINRLRRFLKALARGYGLRCIRAEPVSPPDAKTLPQSNSGMQQGPG